MRLAAGQGVPRCCGYDLEIMNSFLLYGLLLHVMLVVILLVLHLQFYQVLLRLYLEASLYIRSIKDLATGAGLDLT